jgi:hypothetical protein
MGVSSRCDFSCARKLKSVSFSDAMFYCGLLYSAGKKYINNYDNIFGKKMKETQENGGETGNESL